MRVAASKRARGRKNYTFAFSIPVFAVLYYTKTGFLKDPDHRYQVRGRLTKYHTAPSRLTHYVLQWLLSEPSRYFSFMGDTLCHLFSSVLFCGKYLTLRFQLLCVISAPHLLPSYLSVCCHSTVNVCLQVPRYFPLICSPVLCHLSYLMETILFKKNLEQIIQVNLFMGTFARSHQVPDLGAFSMKDRAKD